MWVRKNGNDALVAASQLLTKRERPWFEHVRKMCVMKEKESVFRFFSKEKHFPLLMLCFLCWPELSFRWLVFHVVAKHGKTRKVNSRNSLSCNQTRPKFYHTPLALFFPSCNTTILWQKRCLRFSSLSEMNLGKVKDLEMFEVQTWC
jgi:hypothetical protein